MNRRPGNGAGGGCSEALLNEYVRGHLTPPAALSLERHLVACTTCRYAVESERALMLALRGPGPAVPRDLHLSLLSLATPAVPAGGPVVPAPPVAPHPVLVPLPVVDVRAPAQHRSPMRAAVTAGLAASATAVAALGLGVGAAPAPSTPTTPSLRVSPANILTRPALRQTAVPAGLSVVRTGPTVPVQEPALSGIRGTSAQSVP